MLDLDGREASHSLEVPVKATLPEVNFYAKRLLRATVFAFHENRGSCALRARGL